MTRRLVNLLTLLSLLLSVAVLVLWLRSYRRYMAISYAKAPDRGFNVVLHHGRVLLSSTKLVPPRPLARSSLRFTSVPLDDMPDTILRYDPAKWRGGLGFLYHIAYGIPGGPFAG